MAVFALLLLLVVLFGVGMFFLKSRRRGGALDRGRPGRGVAGGP